MAETKVIGERFRTPSALAGSADLQRGLSNTDSAWARDVDRAMIKNERGVTIRASADEVFSIRIATLRDRLNATKGSETVYWLFRLSCQSRYRVTDPTSQSVSQRIVFCVLATKARNPRYATSTPMFQLVSPLFHHAPSLSLFLPLFGSVVFFPSPFSLVFPFFPIRCFNKRIFAARRVKKRFVHISTSN